MIEAISDKISGHLYQLNDKQHVSQEVMKFALVALITNTATILLSLCIGWLDGKFQETCMAIVAMAFMRLLAGGYHLRSPILCILASTAVVTLVPFIPVYTPTLYIFTAVSAILVWAFAPADSQGHTRLSDRTLRWMKYVVVAVVLANLLIQSEILSVSWFIVSLTLIPITRG